MAKKKAKKFSSFLENPIDYTLLITVLLLLTTGLIMVLSASSPTSLSERGKREKLSADAQSIRVADEIPGSVESG